MSTQVTLVGRLGGDPELRFTAQGKPVASFSMAVQERKMENGQWVDGDTSWYRISAWNRLAENVNESLSRGDLVVLTGRQKVREYEKDGQRRTSVDVTVDAIGPSLQFATAKPVKVEYGSGGGSQPAATSAPHPDDPPF